MLLTLLQTLNIWLPMAANSCIELRVGNNRVTLSLLTILPNNIYAVVLVV